MIRALLLAAAAALALAPGAAMAQAVPAAKKPPPQDERFTAVVDKASSGASLIGSGATVVDTLVDRSRTAATAASEAREVEQMTGFNVMDHPLAPDPHGPAIHNAEKVGDVAKGVGGAAAVVNMTTSAYTFADKCGARNVDASDCTQASLSATSGVAGAMEAVSGSVGAGRVAGAAQLGADLVAVHKNCTSDADDKAECMLSSLDATMSAGGLVPGYQAVPAAYSIGKAVGSAFNWTYEQASGQSLGADLYDWWNGDKDKEAVAAATSAQAFEAARAKRRAAYARTSGELMSKQQAYEAEQARLEAERIAAQQEANRAATSQAFNGDFLANVLQQAYAPSTTTAARGVYLGTGPKTIVQPYKKYPNCIASDELCETFMPGYRPPPRAASPPPRSTPPPSSSGDCGGTGPGTCR